MPDRAVRLEPYFTTGHHDDERGPATTYMLLQSGRMRVWFHFLITTPTIVATLDAALTAAIAVLVLQMADAPTAAVVAAGAVGFVAMWGVLFPYQRQTLGPLREQAPRFPTPSS